MTEKEGVDNNITKDENTNETKPKIFSVESTIEVVYLNEEGIEEDITPKEVEDSEANEDINVVEVVEKEVEVVEETESADNTIEEDETSADLELGKGIIKNKKYRNMIIGLAASICFLIGVYIGGNIYYEDRFYMGSSINSISVSGKTVEEADSILNERLTNYTIVLEGRDGVKSEIQSSAIGLKYNIDSEVKSIFDEQKKRSWVSSVFASKDTSDELLVTYDKELLNSEVKKAIKTLNGNKIIEPENVGFNYTSDGYVLVDEVLGNKINEERLFKEIEEAILSGTENFVLDEKECYLLPSFTKESEKAKETLNLLNKYSKTTVNYSEGKAVLNGEAISTLLDVNDNLDVVINEKGVRGYVDKLATIFNTVGKSREFKTSVGKTVTVGGGNYGIAIDKPKETTEIIQAIKSGESVSKEPKYSQTSYGGGDIGNTYVEINFSRQKIWYYKNGSLITSGNIVTGNVSAGHTTPTGVYGLAYKQRDTVLRGQDYASPVSYWMPFNGGIGIHDATWRNAFGGEIYKTNGSHGCINCPYEVAKAIYNNIETGTPIICYYE